MFDRVTDSYARFYGSGSLWQEEFKMLELSEVMRQKDDHNFVDLLGRVRIAQCTPKDIDILESRVITCDSDSSSYALHVYRLNADVDKRNSEMLNRLTSEKEQIVIESSDSISGQTRHFNLSNL